MHFKNVVLSLCIAVPALGSAAVQAASATSSFDWSHASFSTFATDGGAMSYTWDAHGMASATANGTTTYDPTYWDAEDGVYSAVNTNGNATATALMNTNTWTTQALVSAGAFPAQANAWSQNWGALSVSGTGILLIKVPYTLTVDRSGGGDVSASGQIYASAEGTNSSVNASVFLSNWDSVSARSGVLNFALYSEGSYKGWLNVNTYSAANVAAVPEPESYALMLCGLTLMGVMARRRKARS